MIYEPTSHQTAEPTIKCYLCVYCTVLYKYSTHAETQMTEHQNQYLECSKLCIHVELAVMITINITETAM